MGLQVNIANIQPPSAEEIERMRRDDARLDEFTRLLNQDSQSREDAR
jgi:hypothetical protein